MAGDRTDKEYIRGEVFEKYNNQKAGEPGCAHYFP